MTKRDYQLIAEVIKGLPYVQRVAVVKAFRTKLSEDNPKFDWSKFVAEATYPSDKVWY